jgi:hypothetical protein
MSVCNFHFDEDKGNYILDLRFFADDLLVSLGNSISQTGLSIMDPSEVMVRSYLKDHLAVFINGKEQKIRFVKMKLEELTIYALLQIKTDIQPQEITSLKVVDTILVDDFVNQRNMFHVEMPGKKRRTLLFNFNQKEQTLNF